MLGNFITLKFSILICFRDPHKLEVYSVEYVVDNGSIAFAVTDADKNLILYTHQVHNFSF